MELVYLALLFSVALGHPESTLSVSDFINSFSHCSIHIFTAPTVNIFPTRPPTIPLTLSTADLNFNSKLTTRPWHATLDHLPCRSTLFLQLPTVPQVTAKAFNWDGAGTQDPARSIRYNFIVTTESEYLSAANHVQAVAKYGNFGSKRSQSFTDLTRITIIVRNNQQLESPDLVHFKYFYYACCTCEHASKTRMMPHRVWIIKDGRRVLFVQYFEAIRARILKNVPHLPLLSREGVHLSNLGYLEHAPKPVLEVLFDLKRRYGNKSVKLERPTVAPGKEVSEAYLEYRRDQMLYPYLKYESSASTVNPSDTFIPDSYSYFTFITCDAMNTTQFGSTYIKPFQLNLWITVGAAYLLTVTILLFHFGYRDMTGHMLLVGAVLLENARIPTNYLSSNKSRLFAGSFMLVTVVVSNCYRGKVTATATAPWERKNFQSFDQLLSYGFQFYSPIAKRFREYSSNETIWRQVLSTDAIKLHYEPELNRSDFVLSEFGLMVKQSLADFCYLDNTQRNCRFKSFERQTYENTTVRCCYPPEIKKQFKYLKRLVIPRSRPDESIRERVSECNRAALISWGDRIGSFIPSERWWAKHGSTKMFVKGKDKLLLETTGWEFNSDRRSGRLLSRFFRRLAIESGVFNWLKKADGFKRPNDKTLDLIWKRKETGAGSKTALSFKSEVITTLFVVFGCCALACMATFLGEICFVCLMCGWIVRVIKRFRRTAVPTIILVGPSAASRKSLGE